MAAADLHHTPKIDTLEEGRDNGRPRRARRDYRPPQLVEFGDVRDVVLGITPGIGDSGNPTLFKP